MAAMAVAAEVAPARALTTSSTPFKVEWVGSAVAAGAAASINPA